MEHKLHESRIEKEKKEELLKQNDEIGSYVDNEKQEVRTFKTIFKVLLVISLLSVLIVGGTFLALESKYKEARKVFMDSEEILSVIKNIDSNSGKMIEIAYIENKDSQTFKNSNIVISKNGDTYNIDGSINGKIITNYGASYDDVKEIILKDGLYFDEYTGKLGGLNLLEDGVHHEEDTNYVNGEVYKNFKEIAPLAEDKENFKIIKGEDIYKYEVNDGNKIFYIAIAGE